jgi:hypothetical protein
VPTKDSSDGDRRISVLVRGSTGPRAPRQFRLSTDKSEIDWKKVLRVQIEIFDLWARRGGPDLVGMLTPEVVRWATEEDYP